MSVFSVSPLLPGWLQQHGDSYSGVYKNSFSLPPSQKTIFTLRVFHPKGLILSGIQGNCRFRTVVCLCAFGT